MKKLNQSDLDFLCDDENWHFGPVIEIIFYYPGLDVISNILKAFFELNQIDGPFEKCEDIALDKTIDNQDFQSALCIINDPKFNLGPVGAKVFYRTLKDDDLTDFWMAIYPPQMKRICSIYPWHPRPGWVTSEIVNIYAMLVQMCRDLHELRHFHIASIHDEAYGWGMNAENGIAVHKDVAAEASWSCNEHVHHMAILPF